MRYYSFKYQFKCYIKVLRSNDYLFKKIFKSLKSTIKGLIAIVFTIITVGWATLGKEWDIIFKSSSIDCIAIPKWQDSLNNIRIHESKEYIEEIIGTPLSSKKYNTHKIDKMFSYEKTVYINEYFTLICIYTDESLKGFLLIGNNEKFTQRNYRVGFSLFSDTISTASEKCDDLLMWYTFISANCGERIDNNRYYIECKEQHSLGGGESVTVGYGYCDIGYMSETKSNIDAYLRTPLNSAIYAHSRYICINDMLDSKHKIDQEEFQILLQDESVKSMRNNPINAFLVFDGQTKDDTILLQESLINSVYLGINKETYANLCNDFIGTLYENYLYK